MHLAALLSVAWLCLFAIVPVSGQAIPGRPDPSAVAATDTVAILGLEVEGVEDEGVRSVILQASGLQIGQTVVLPGGPVVAEAVRRIYRLGRFSHVAVVVKEREERGARLVLRVRAEARLREYTLDGIGRKERRALREQLPLFVGAPVRPGDAERARIQILNYYYDRGYRLVRVGLDPDTLAGGEVALHFLVERGPRVEVGEVRIEGNEAFSDRTLRRQMRAIKEDRWWRIWRPETYDPAGFREDLDRILSFYNDHGYYDAEIVRDTAYVRRDGSPDMVVAFRVREGRPYYVRHVSWSGHALVSESELTEVLDFERGDVYDRSRIQKNLFAHPRGEDLAGLYLNRGHLRFGVEPRVIPVAGDSLDLHFRISEGPVYTFGRIRIAGNEITRDHVVRRALYTVPGDTFSRAAIQASVESLLGLGYFTGESLAGGPELDVNDARRTVDLLFALEEANTERFDVAGGFTSAGLFLRLGITLRNFSLRDAVRPSRWNPLPAGDGQQLGASVATNGSAFQQVALQFVEPWFRGRPGQAGVDFSHTRIHERFDASAGDENVHLFATSARFFLQRPLRPPDGPVSLSGGAEFRRLDNEGWTTSLAPGINREFVVRAGASRTSFDHPLHPRTGSHVGATLDVAAPIDRLVGDVAWMSYRKWRLATAWNAPLGRRAAIGLEAGYGYVGAIGAGGDRFQRFVLGGSPFDTEGVTDYFGRDVVHVRGYPVGAIGPRRGDGILGGRLYNRYAAELRWMIFRRPQLAVVPYLFAEAANAWPEFSSYQPSVLFRSSGVGLRLVVPLLGPLEASYGYNFDRFDPIGDHDGSSRWLFQFFFGAGGAFGR